MTLDAGRARHFPRERRCRRSLAFTALAMATLSVLANVGPENPREFQDVVSTPERLRPLAEATGGTVRRIGKRL